MVINTNQRHHGLAVLEINGVKYAMAQSSVMANQITQGKNEETNEHTINGRVLKRSIHYFGKY